MELANIVLVLKTTATPVHAGNIVNIGKTLLLFLVMTFNFSLVADSFCTLQKFVSYS